MSSTTMPITGELATLAQGVGVLDPGVEDVAGDGERRTDEQTEQDAQPDVEQRVSVTCTSEDGAVAVSVINSRTDGWPEPVVVL